MGHAHANDAPAPATAPGSVRTIPLGKLADRPWPGKLTDAGLDVKADIENLDHYYVASDVTARTRCIDGRHDPELDEDHLGPQVPGGAPGAALAHPWASTPTTSPAGRSTTTPRR